MSNTYISPENTWALWAFLTGWAAISIYLEQKYAWASKMSGAIIALIGAMVLSNFRIIPVDAPAYDQVWGYVVPLAIPLLLFKCDILKIWRESGRMLVIFLISSIGTMLGGILAFYLLKDHIPSLNKIAAMMAGSYIGGSVNFAAMAEAFNPPKEMSSAAVVADNLLMALYFFVLIGMTTMRFFRKNYSHPYIEQVEKDGVSEDQTLAAKYWGRKEISLKDIAFSIGTAFFIVAVSTELGKWLGNVIPTGNPFLFVLNTLFSNKYLLITTVTMIGATRFSVYFENIRGAQEIGTFLIYIFFVVIGVPASIPLIIQQSPLLLVFCTIIVFINMLVSFSVGKLLNFKLEEIILASNANIGGPTTAAAMAISKGWTDLVGPVMLVGTLGYVVGNYFGLLMGSMLQ
ncbi:MAG: DUF819 family protein [Peptostreptococcaceae bacterium]|nr:DUF819 family protein [Peptostreptococcaceae bacterium]